jgi:putative hemin transport protein
MTGLIDARAGRRMHDTLPTHPHLDLSTRWSALRAEQPRLRIRDAAASLGVSELELRATTLVDRPLHEPGALLLAPAGIRALLGELHTLGEVMALTRNEAAVHEKIGCWEPLSIRGDVGLVLDDPIDLRLFLTHWAHALAVAEPIEHGPEAGRLRLGLHFFDAQGDALHKVFVREPERAFDFHALVARFVAAEQRLALPLPPPPDRQSARPDAEIDVAGLQAAWLAMTDTHEFFPLLHRFAVTRTQALRLAPPGHAEPLAPTAIVDLLARASERAVPIMVFVPNPGCIQIHTGPVERVVELGPWINVMDPGFNLHLRRDLVAEAWRVHKPTSDGLVGSLELFDAQGQAIALVFGARKPGTPELPSWRALLAELA